MLSTFASALMLSGLAAGVQIADQYYPYKTASVKSKEEFVYGRFTTSFLAPNRNGTCTSLFTYWSSPDWTIEEWNELDIEIVPSKKWPFSSNIIGANKSFDHLYIPDFQPNPDGEELFNEYVLEWTPDYIAWSANGQELRRVTGTESVRFQNKPQKVTLNFWSPTYGGWGDNFTDEGMPWYAKFDYVEVETYNEETGEFEPHWREDFEGTRWNWSRWSKMNGWGYSSSSSDFNSDNAYLEDGCLVIKMEHRLPEDEE